MFVARDEKFLALARRKFVRRAIAPAFLNECERTIIYDDVFAEKILRAAKSIREQSPQSFAADLAPVTIEAENRSFRILAFRFIDLRRNAEPIAHCGDLAEWNSGLRHAERAGIHAEKDHALGRIAVTAQINFMRPPGVIEWVVNMRDR